MTATTKQKAEIVFVGVTTEQYRPGKKLTKSLFRQVVMGDPPKDEEVDILGWVNYWPSHLACLFTSDGGKGVGWFSATANNDWLHILWRTSGGELRRFFMPNPMPANVEEAEQMSRGRESLKAEDRESMDRYYIRSKKQWDEAMAKGQLYLAGI